jgi:hypothetical protein
MNRLSIVLVALAAAASQAPAEIAFGPVRAQPGESVRLVSHSECKDGTIEVNGASGEPAKGTIRMVRERDLSWTFRAPEADGTLRGMVGVNAMKSTTSVTIDGKEEKTADESPLNGMMFAMSKPPGGDWNFQLDGSLPRHRVEGEINELIVYLNRRWYPEHVVKVGDVWEFDPAWIRMIIEKDLKGAQTIGTMKLRQVRHNQQAHVALIDVSVRSSGGEFEPGGAESKFRIELTGQVTVNLKTMLDERIELEGTLVTQTGTPGSEAVATLPLKLKVEKSLVRN